MMQRLLAVGLQVALGERWASGAATFGENGLIWAPRAPSPARGSTVGIRSISSAVAVATVCGLKPEPTRRVTSRPVRADASIGQGDTGFHRLHTCTLPRVVQARRDNGVHEIHLQHAAVDPHDIL